jgi:hypothetical protein
MKTTGDEETEVLLWVLANRTRRETDRRGRHQGEAQSRFCTVQAVRSGGASDRSLNWSPGSPSTPNCESHGGPMPGGTEGLGLVVRFWVFVPFCVDFFAWVGGLDGM